MPIVVLLSGSGSNFAAIAAAAADGSLAVEVRAAISDRPAAFGLERARALGIPAVAVPVADFPDREQHDAALARAIDHYDPALVVCAGYMRIFTTAFVSHYADRMLNIHPSLLPAYRGLHTHRRVLADHGRWHGCSVHFVTEELDGGPLVAQAPVPVLPGDSEASLSARVHRAEHRLYPTVLEWYARGRLRCEHGRAWLDQQPLETPVRLEDLDGET
ncbi:MAG: phosphoribosylglycinamide formyltransferase [Proteobacteria bacterium]|nr:phosphoribosylglycinamide formyltransferase [Pseudomonadota bacterium]